MSEVKTWIITVGGGYGSFEFIGTEEEAEEMRRHKAEWEGAVARKILKSEIYHILGGEIERLRTALEEVYEELKTLYFMIDHDEDIFYERKKKYLSIIDHVGHSVAGQAISTTSAPTAERVRNDVFLGEKINEKCPKCGADMLANRVGDKWCSLVGCDYSINAPEGDGDDA